MRANPVSLTRLVRGVALRSERQTGALMILRSANPAIGRAKVYQDHRLPVIAKSKAPDQSREV